MTTTMLPEAARTAIVTTEVRINATPERVYRAWCDDTRLWFYEKPGDQTEKPTVFEERLGGRFYIDLGDRGFNVLGEVTMVKKNEKLRIRGDCTMPNAFVANMTVSFDPDSEGESESEGDGTRVTVEHRMAGEFPDDLPAGFEEGWLDGLTKLKAHCEG